MAGFPLQHLDKHLKILVQQNKRFVALCEEFRKPAGSDTFNERAFERRVTRVLTPGTLIDESFLNHYQNNYLLAIGRPNYDGDGDSTESGLGLGLAWLDVSTGEFFAQKSSMEELRDDIARIGPQEVVVDRYFEASPHDSLRKLLADENCLVSYAEPEPVQSGVDSGELAKAADTTDDITSVSSSADDLERRASGGQDVPTSSNPVFDTFETSAIRLLNSYLRENLMGHAPQLIMAEQPRAQRAGVERMQIDAHTIKALEIHEGLREGGVKGTLLSVIRRTTTSSGTRLLARWLSALCLEMSLVVYLPANLLRFPEHLDNRDLCSARSRCSLPSHRACPARHPRAFAPH